MQPGERIAVIKRIAKRLGAGDDWSEIDLTLEQFGFDTWDQWGGTKEEYIRYSIKRAPDDMLAALDQYLMGDASPDEEPWEDNRFRLFITHVAKHKLTAHELKSFLAFYGIDGFVAHEDISPGKEWQLVIQSALHSCDALVALLHDGFRESDWCDQEVGVALGRGVPVVPINFDLNPYGFFGSVQAINSHGLQMKLLTRKLVGIYLADKRTAERLAEAMVERLVHARSYDQANTLSRMLVEDAPLLDRDQVTRLRAAAKTNSQLSGAFNFDGYVSLIEQRIEAAAPSPPVPYDPAEEPF